MLDRFKKYFAGNTANTPASADNTKEVEMTVEEKATADANAVQLKEAQATLVAQAADLEALTELVAELSGKFEVAQAALAQAEQSKVDLVAEAKAKTLAARKEKVTAIVGTVKAEEFMTAAGAFSDVQFEAVVGMLAASFDNENKSLMFKEVGVSATADATQVVEESAEMKALKAKYAQS